MPAASEIVCAVRVLDGPAAIDILRDALDMAYLKGKLEARAMASPRCVLAWKRYCRN